MTALILVLLTGFLAYLVSAVLVGFTLALFITKKKIQLGSLKAAVMIFCLFIFLDLFAYPAMLSLDVTFTVHETFIAELFEVGPNARLGEIMSLGLFDVFVWGLQTAVAVCVADTMKVKEENV